MKFSLSLLEDIDLLHVDSLQDGAGDGWEVRFKSSYQAVLF